MKEYEVILTYLTGCAGEAYPITSFEEVEATSPAEYIRAKPKEFDQFVSESPAPGKEIWKLDNGFISYTYEFNEL